MVEKDKSIFYYSDKLHHIIKGFFIKNKAFTLAEVLITLGIIGVVAALTMPVLIANYRKQQTVTQLKKVYSALQQSIQFSQANYGDIDSWDWSLGGSDFFEQYLSKNFNVIKNCGMSSECWNKTGALQLKGTQYIENPLNSDNWYTLILSDGVYLALLKQDNTHFHVLVDLNGDKMPNMFGKDIFEMTMTAVPFNDNYHKITKAGLYFYGYGLTRDELLFSSAVSCSKNGSGQFCGGLIQYDGWQINKEYPW